MKTMVAVYIGRRITTKNRLVDFWQFEHEETSRGYRKSIAPAKVGERWSFTVEGESSVQLDSRKALGFIDDKDKIREWVAEDIAAVSFDAQRKADATLSRRLSDYERALEPMRLIVASARTHRDRAAIIAQVTADLWKKPEPRRYG